MWCNVSPPGNADVISWKLNGNENITTKSVWDHPRNKDARSDWFTFVWGAWYFPRHNFTNWLAVLNRLYSKQTQVTMGRILM